MRFDPVRVIELIRIVIMSAQLLLASQMMFYHFFGCHALFEHILADKPGPETLQQFAFERTKTESDGQVDLYVVLIAGR